jgi:hypothetical protein
LLDTRSDASATGPIGYSGAKPGQGGVVTLGVRGQAGIPADATAVVLNVTATDATDAGFVTVWPTGQPRPTASSLNVERAGQTIPNQVIVPIGADGTVSLFTQRGTDFVVDASGWFGAGSYQPITPTRVLDTRPAAAPSGPLGYSGAKPGQGGIVVVRLPGVAGIPAAAKTAVVNVTATEATAPGFVTVWPSDQARPNASNLNLEQPGQTIANAVVVGLSPDGEFSLFTQRGTHLVVDVVGWSP